MRADRLHMRGGLSLVALVHLSLATLSFVTNRWTFRGRRPDSVRLRAETGEDVDLDLESLAIPTLRRSSLKMSVKPSTEVDIDAVTARVQKELGGRVFQAPVEDAEDDSAESSELKTAAGVLQQWALKGIQPDMPQMELMAELESALRRDSPDPIVFASLMWSCGRIKIDHIAPLLAPLRDRLPEVVQDMNAQNLTTVWCAAAKMQAFAEEVDSMIEHIIEAIIEKAGDLKPHHISAFIWAAGKLDLRSEEVRTITENIPRRVSRSEMQRMPLKDIANFAFGLAQLDFRDAAMLQIIAQTTREMAEKCRRKAALQDLPMIVMSLTRLGYEEKEMDSLLDAVAAKLQSRPRMLKKMDDWALAALYWSWPQDRSRPGVRDMQVLLLPEVERRISKNRFSSRMLERSWMGPSEWKLPLARTGRVARSAVAE